MGCFQLHNLNSPYCYEKKLENNRKEIVEIDIYKFSKNALKQHNIYRKKHNAKPLELDDDLQRFAQKHAEKMAKEDKEIHSSCKLENGEIIGESLYSNNNLFTGQKMTEEFYEEKNKENYDINKEEEQINATRFTQLIWKSTESVGFGVAINKISGKIYAVANYFPSGNSLGNYKENISNLQKT